MNPQLVANLLEGAIAFGLSSLRREITLERGRVQQSNFHDFPILKLPETPTVDIAIAASTVHPTGVG